MLRRLLSIATLLMFMLFIFSGCEVEKKDSAGASAKADFSKTDTDMFSERDSLAGFDKSTAIAVNLSDSGVDAGSDSVKISGSKVTFTKEGVYVISGTLSDGMLTVDAKDTAKIQLVFSGASITSKSSAALYILNADKVFLTLADGTQNTLSNGGSFVQTDTNNVDGAMFSKQDLTINGSGALTVTSPAGHGIVCKDDLVITGGTQVINCASHGLDANDSVRIANADISVEAGKDAIHCENSEDTSKGFIYISSGSVKATAQGDGISASAYMQIKNGRFDLLIGGGAESGDKARSDSFGGFMGGRPYSAQNTETDSTSMKGLKSAGDMLISGGNFTINSADDCVHSDGSLTLNGANLTLASGDDALHAENTLAVKGADVDISECYEGLEALHVDVSGGSIKLKASDDGLNAAGGKDGSGFTGGRDGMFGGGRPDRAERPGGERPEAPAKQGGMGGMSANSDGSIKISGGTLYINSSGDGIDANGTLEITGGHITVVGPTHGDTATLDYDKTGIITGGTFIGTGASGGMAQTFSESGQAVISVNVQNQTAKTQITLKDSKGDTIVSHSPELDFAVIIISSPKLAKGEAYTLTVGQQTIEVNAR